MSIVFFGTPDFAVPSLKALLASREEIALVVTQPDRVNRGRTLPPPPVKAVALEAGLKVVQPEKIRDETFVRQLESLEPEFIIVVAYGKILPETILHLPSRGCVNVHASLLPKYRGAAPVAWAIVNGEKETGITTMLMDEGLDTGDILLQREMEISDKDTAGSLGQKLSDLGARVLMETVSGMRLGTVTPTPQKGEVTYAPPLRKEDGLIDWSKSAWQICNFVRGMQPWPGARCDIGNERVTLLETLPSPGQAQLGTISRITKDVFFIGTGDGLLSVMELQPAGKKPMSASAFIQGRRLGEGISVR